MGKYRLTAEDGISLVLLLILLPLLILFLAFVLFTGHTTLVRTELQSAADSAAHAGATILCSKRECYQAARDTAAWTISKQIAHGKPDSDPNLVFSYNPADAGPTWTGGDLEVTIERGRWSPDNGFYSLEGWDDNTSPNYSPGMVGYVTANALKVTIRRTGVTASTSAALYRSANVSATATAVNDTPQKICVAPFAIPLCAVINSNGNYDPDKIDNNTRYFTAVSRHCPPGDKFCNNVPAFPIEPTTESDVLREYLPVTPVPNVPADFTNVNKMRVFLDKRPGFNTDRYTSNPFDNYGVIGFPGNRGTEVKEDQIRQELDRDGERGCYPSHVGQLFQILPAGLKEKETNEAMWRRITGNIFGGADEPATAHPEFWKTDLGEHRKLGTIKDAPDPEGWGIQHNSYLGDCRAQGLTPGSPMVPDLNWAFCHLPHPVRPNGDPNLEEGYSTDHIGAAAYVPVQNDIDGDFANNGGLCNSTRLLKSLEQFPPPADFDLRYSFFDAWTSWYSALSNVIVTDDGRYPGAGSPAMMRVMTDLNMALTPVWQIEVPVIASQGARGSFCQGTAPDSTGPSPVPAQEDPVDPDLDWEIVGFVKVNFYDTDIGMDPPALPERYPDGTAFPAALPSGSHPFSFNQRCNVVRGKVNGKVKTFRSGADDSKRSTLLVE